MGLRGMDADPFDRHNYSNRIEFPMPGLAIIYL
jgi:hypothetical protein